jgi:eukaryotic-like serine/threonine-protein kinase
VHPDPGTIVVDRYALERQIVDATHVTLWRGHDTVLDRPVAVRIVEPEHPRVTEVIDAARSTTRVDDRRVARVLDAAERVDDPAGGAYVVTAWAEGQDLDTVLADGPLEPTEAVALVAEVAEAVANAHAAGIAHLALDPTNVVLDRARRPEHDDDGPAVTVLGLAVDAVLWPEQCEKLTDPEARARADARGLGALLYACLTARWPADPEACALRDAPRISARLCTPAQVRAAVPTAVDHLCRRALGEDLGPGPIETPAAFGVAARDLLAQSGRSRLSRWFGRGSRSGASRG